ncbi:MAG: hypothetical protein IPO15_10560 [Anaerolineae bacterium]|uniref:hypothetical protein n=1 Tax=Candidatus Amarolinea dominans TaxID=3140696 RepID=UPI0031348693|nr:hypothetical protein [Anaerolineae bacterium]
MNLENRVAVIPPASGGRGGAARPGRGGGPGFARNRTTTPDALGRATEPAGGTLAGARGGGSDQPRRASADDDQVVAAVGARIAVLRRVGVGHQLAIEFVHGRHFDKLVSGLGSIVERRVYRADALSIDMMNSLQ